MFLVKSFILNISYVKRLILQMFDDFKWQIFKNFLPLSAFNALDVKRHKQLLRMSTQSAGQGLSTFCQKCHWCSLYRAATVQATSPVCRCCRRPVLFYKIQARSLSCWSYLLWRPCSNTHHLQVTTVICCQPQCLSCRTHQHHLTVANGSGPNALVPICHR